MTATTLGAAALAFVCVLLLWRHDNPAPVSHPDDLTLGYRALRAFVQRRRTRAEELAPVLGDRLIDRIAAMARSRPDGQASSAVVRIRWSWRSATTTPKR